MKVIKNAIEERKKNIPASVHIQCEHCESILEITQQDVYSGKMLFNNEVGQQEYGEFDKLVKCPCCGSPTRPVMVQLTEFGYELDPSAKFPY